MENLGTEARKDLAEDKDRTDLKGVEGTQGLTGKEAGKALPDRTDRTGVRRPDGRGRRAIPERGAIRETEGTQDRKGRKATEDRRNHAVTHTY